MTRPPVEFQLRVDQLVAVEPSRAGDALVVGLDHHTLPEVDVVVAPSVDRHEAQVVRTHGDELAVLAAIAVCHA